MNEQLKKNFSKYDVMKILQILFMNPLCSEDEDLDELKIYF